MLSKSYWSHVAFAFVLFFKVTDDKINMVQLAPHHNAAIHCPSDNTFKMTNGVAWKLKTFQLAKRLVFIYQLDKFQIERACVKIALRLDYHNSLRINPALVLIISISELMVNVCYNDSIRSQQRCGTNPGLRWDIESSFNS